MHGWELWGEPEHGGRSEPTGKQAVPEQSPVFGTRQHTKQEELLELEGPHIPFINSRNTFSANYEAPDVVALVGSRQAAALLHAALVLSSSAEASKTPLCQPQSTGDSVAGQPGLYEDLVKEYQGLLTDTREASRAR